MLSNRLRKGGREIPASEIVGSSLFAYENVSSGVSMRICRLQIGKYTLLNTVSFIDFSHLI